MTKKEIKKWRERYHSVAIDNDVYDLFALWCKINNYGDKPKDVKNKIQEILRSIASGKASLNHNATLGES